MIWGSGVPLREFLYVDDLADACLLLMRHYSDEEIINVGSGEEISIGRLAELIAELIGFQGALTFDPSKPDGTPRKRLDNSLHCALGWSPSIRLPDGLRRTVEDFAREATRTPA